jgi:hypothetical protein
VIEVHRKLACDDYIRNMCIKAVDSYAPILMKKIPILKFSSHRLLLCAYNFLADAIPFWALVGRTGRDTSVEHLWSSSSPDRTRLHVEYLYFDAFALSAGDTGELSCVPIPCLET